VSTAEWLASGALLAGGAATGAFAVTRARVRRLEARLRVVEQRLTRDVEPAVVAAAEDARAATRTARDAAARVGIEEPPPRVPLEPVTGPVVRAVALGAGAGRAIARLARPRPRRNGK
jgi:hypothetical protein